MVESAMLVANISAAQFVYDHYPHFGLFRNQIQPAENSYPLPAFYDFNNDGHWGLQTDFYTHFTKSLRKARFFRSVMDSSKCVALDNGFVL